MFHYRKRQLFAHLFEHSTMPKKYEIHSKGIENNGCFCIPNTIHMIDIWTLENREKKQQTLRIHYEPLETLNLMKT